MLTKNGYKKRLVDSKVERNLGIFGALSIEGPKWCGKTWMALNHSSSVVYLNNPENGYQDKRYAMMDPNIILGKDAPELLDEWQEVPGLWDAVRFHCDEDQKTGKYILTGSATPVANKIHHSGAGRICRMKMYTMSLFETGDSGGEVSLSGLFSGDFENKTVKNANLKDLAKFIVRGGWPANLEKNVEDMSIIPKSYLDDVLLHDISSIDGVNRNQSKMSRLIRSLARNESSTASGQKILSDITDSSLPGEQIELSRNSLADYLDVLQKLYIIDNVESYSANVRSSDRVGVAVKRHFTDPSLAAAALGLSIDGVIGDLNTFGLLFESLCLHDLRVYCECFDGKLYHFRNNKTGLEVDAIVEMPNGDYGAIEVKLGTDSEDAAAKNLLAFADSMEKKPKFLAVVNGLGGAVVKRPDGVYAFPITALRD